MARPRGIEPRFVLVRSQPPSSRELRAREHQDKDSNLDRRVQSPSSCQLDDPGLRPSGRNRTDDAALRGRDVSNFGEMAVGRGVEPRRACARPPVSNRAPYRSVNLPKWRHGSGSHRRIPGCNRVDFCSRTVPSSGPPPLAFRLQRPTRVRIPCEGTRAERKQRDSNPRPSA